MTVVHTSSPITGGVGGRSGKWLRGSRSSLAIQVCMLVDDPSCPVTLQDEEVPGSLRGGEAGSTGSLLRHAHPQKHSPGSPCCRTGLRFLFSP